MKSILFQLVLDGSGAASSEVEKVKARIKELKALIADLEAQKLLGGNIDTSQLEKAKRELGAIQAIQKANRAETRKLSNEFTASGKAGVGAYRQLSAQLIKLRGEYKDLAAAGQGQTTQAKALLAQVGQLDKRLKSIDASTGQFQRNVGNYSSAFKGIGGIVRGITGIGSATILASTAIRGAINNIADFERGLDNLASITGLQGQALDNLADKADNLAIRFGISATDILQAYEKIGSNQPELLSNPQALAEVTEQALILAKALKIDVAEAGSILTGSLNAYGQSAAEAAKFTDILATSQQKGASTADLIAEALVKAGPIARANNQSFEETNAILQGFARANIKGANAGTAFVQIMNRLAKTGRDDLNPALTKFDDILETLSQEVTTVAEAQAIFGQRAGSTALALINQRDEVARLNGALNENGNALSQAQQNASNFRAESAKLAATWGVFTKELLDGESGLSNFLKESTKGVRTLLGNVTQALKNPELSFLDAFTSSQIGVDLTEVIDEASKDVEDLSNVTISANKDISESTKETVKQRQKSIEKVKEEKVGLEKLRQEISELKKELDRNAGGDITSTTQRLIDKEKELTDELERQAEVKRTLQGRGLETGSPLLDNIGLSGAGVESNTAADEDKKQLDERLKIYRDWSDKREEISEAAEERERERLEQTAERFGQSAEQVGELFSELFTGQIESTEEFMSELGNIIIEGIINQMEAYALSAIAREVATKGLAGIVTGGIAAGLVRGLAGGLRSLLAEDGVLLDANGNVVGPSHRNGGVQTGIRTNQGMLEVEGGENMQYDEFGNLAVINKRATRRNQSFLNRIRNKSYPGKLRDLSRINSSVAGGVRFAMNGISLPRAEGVSQSIIDQRALQQGISLGFKEAIPELVEGIKDGSRQASQELGDKIKEDVRQGVYEGSFDTRRRQESQALQASVRSR